MYYDLTDIIESNDNIILSYGAGVDSFGYLCGVALEQLPRPTAIVFADTQGESQETYQHLHEVAIPFAKSELGLDIEIITRGNLLQDSFSKGHTPRPPLCSWMYKRDVINAHLKQTDRLPAISIICIGYEESQRAYKTSANPRITNIYPLVDRKLTRRDVTDFIKVMRQPVPEKSGCWFCPNRNAQYFATMRNNQPERFDLLVNIESQTGHTLRRDNVPLFEAVA